MLCISTSPELKEHVRKPGHQVSVHIYFRGAIRNGHAPGMPPNREHGFIGLFFTKNNLEQIDG
jgi:hypothetical protein